MSRRLKLILAAGLGLAMVAGSAGVALALEANGAAELRASGQAGEQADGYLGVVNGGGSGALHQQVDAINIKRRAFYTDLASKRGGKIEEVAASTACELLRNEVAPGQYYRLRDGVWRRRDSAPVPLPAYCP
ncbi:MAG: hypothetical protein JWO25_524 [Alphaproteobacteria bacterium]|nr:hypothetical protein [Alphaproteobacteria bacterium]MDB5721178.1 hypothetical protein [Alphaproteobacteria bacterium]